MNKIFYGDCRESLQQMAADGIKVQTCVTSPPYFGLRDYGVDGQLGLEQTPDEYVQNMVEVFRCVRDVLADDGTLWLNLGDSYAANRGYQVPSTKGGAKHSESQAAGGKGSTVPDGLKPKDLIGIPWRVALALQAAGWYLRQDIIWHKPNPMPESVRDRCTKAHEYVFLLSKGPRYFFDADAIREPSADAEKSSQRHRYSFFGGNKHQSGGYSADGSKHTAGMKKFDGMRNRRSVWTVATRPYKGAHFAVFPPALIEPCILAGSRPGDIVLDPFMGSGTTAVVAVQHGRQYIGCELNTDYAPLIEARVSEATPCQ